MTTRDRSVLPGTVDLLVLKVLAAGPLHGFAVSRTLRRLSEGVVSLEDAALYQALHRMARRKWIRGEWGRTGENRRARYYHLTERGRSQLEAEEAAWREHAGAIARVLERA